MKVPPGIALLKGRQPHKASEVNYKQKIASGVDLPLKMLEEVAADEFDQSVAKDGYVLTPDEQSIGAQIVLGKAKDRGIALTGLWHTHVAPTVQPAIVEEFIRVELPSHSHDLLGRLDVATKDAKIIDLKTAGRSKYQGEVDSSIQLTWYSVAYEWLTGKPPLSVQLDVLVDLKTPKVQRLESFRGPADTQVLLHRLNAMDASIKAGIIKPAAIGSPMCSPKFCGYWNQCPWVNSERAAAAEAE